MDDLTSYVCQVSQEDFGKPFVHQAYWNTRLRSTGGRFFPKDGHLDFNPKHLEVYGLAVFRQIVRHELCHYHLYFEGRGYRHGDTAFKALLKQVGGIRYAPALPTTMSGYQYVCQTCGQVYRRQRRVNLAKYRCGKCRGGLLPQP